METDLVLARQEFADAGLSFPCLPAGFERGFRRFGALHAGTRRLSRGDMYFFEVHPLELLSRPVEPYLAFCHAGHGINSWALCYHLVTDRLAVFFQNLWGGVYTDAERAASLWRGAAEKTELLLARLREREELLPAGRLVVVDSDFRGVESFGWLIRPAGDGGGRVWLERHRSERKGALRGALEWLDRF